MTTELVVKVGGSLYDVPDLGRRLREWLDAQGTRCVLLVPGGGVAAHLVRQADSRDRLGEERSHWLALLALQFNAHLLAARLPGAIVIGDVTDRLSVCERGQLPIIDMHAFASGDERCAHHLPHVWEVTSDSLAARVAVVAGIAELVLLKSCDLPAGCSWSEAATQGIVDEVFPTVLQSARSELRATVVNFRRFLRAGASGSTQPGPEP